MDINIVIGGEAGQGLDTMDKLLAGTFFRMGYYIYSTKDYMSRVRGGHNFMQLRVSTAPISSHVERIDILVALDRETVKRHRERLTKDGVILSACDLEECGERFFSIAAEEIAQDIGSKKAANTVLAGALFRILGLETSVFKKQLVEKFTGQVLKLNIKAQEQGYKRAEEVYSLPVPEPMDDQLLLGGNEAVALGAAFAGVQFYTAYPMTPSTGIMNYLAEKQEELGIAVEQAEDEIAAINMAIGASYSGIRAMTGTSGGGFSLMNEGLGLAGITETPLVVAEVQRPGPATGLPTRTEQGDLLFVINSSQGEFPLMVTAPRDAEDAFYQTFRAFNIADIYQIPVVVLSDQFLADTARNVSRFDLDSLKIRRGLVEGEEVGSEYGRYTPADNGISPRAYPGQLPGQVVLADSDEHDHLGHIIEDAQTRREMVEKRARKMDQLRAVELLEPLYVGGEDIDILLLGWGSTYGPLLECCQLLREEGNAVGLLSFNDLWPFPSKGIRDWAKRDLELVMVENNSTAQMARLMRGETGIAVDHSILKYDGRPFSSSEIYERVKSEVIR